MKMIAYSRNTENTEETPSTLSFFSVFSVQSLCSRCCAVLPYFHSRGQGDTVLVDDVTRALPHPNRDDGYDFLAP